MTDWFRKMLMADRKAHDCPCCGQVAKVYRRSITGAMVFQLKVLYRHGPLVSREWNRLNVEGGLGQAGVGDMTKLAYWGLIAKDRESSKWHVTRKGYNFLFWDLEIPRYAYVYDGAVQSHSDETMKASHARDFEYYDL